MLVQPATCARLAQIAPVGACNWCLEMAWLGASPEHREHRKPVPNPGSLAKTVRIVFCKIRNRSHPLLYVFASSSVKKPRLERSYSHRLLELTFSAEMERSGMMARPD
jgi:hypothetical protein